MNISNLRYLEFIMKKRYYAYGRTSTTAQKDAGNIKVQIDEIKAHAKKNDIEICEWFLDDGVSGSEEKREGINQMLMAFDKNPDVQGCIFYSCSRLGREMRIQEQIIYELQDKRGLELLSVTEPDLGDSQPERVLLRQIVGSVNQYDKRQIVLRLTTGRNNKAKNGGYAGGTSGLGYKVEGGELVIDPIGAETVKLIFKLRRSRLKKYSYQAIADELNQQGLLNAKGKSFSGQGVRGVLNSKRYKGKLIFGNFSTYREDLKVA